MSDQTNKPTVEAEVLPPEESNGLPEVMEKLEMILESGALDDLINKRVDARHRQQLAVKDEDKQLTAQFAHRYGVPQEKVLDVVRETCFPSKIIEGKDGAQDQVIAKATDAQLMQFLAVANHYGLNPFIKEIYAFAGKSGAVVPIVGVDGWINLMRRQPNYLRKEFRYSEEMVEHEKGEHQPAHKWVECAIYLKDAPEDPEVVREYFDEVYQAPRTGKGKNGGEYSIKGPWQTHTKRMQRHKVMIQAARYAFGFGGIYDEDEGRRIVDVTPPERVDGAKEHGQMWKAAKPATIEAQSTNEEKSNDRPQEQTHQAS